MAEWHGIRASLTKEQREVIEKFKKKNRIKNDNQFIKYAIEEIIGVNLADAKRPENMRLPKEYLTVYYFFEYLKRAFKSTPETQKTLEDLFKNWASGFWGIHTRKQNKKLVMANAIWDHFKQQRKVGRPSKPKRKRGKPIDKGYER